MKKYFFLFCLAISAPVHAEVAVVLGLSGSLVYSDGTDGDYKSLVYEDKAGKVFKVFDEGLVFNYDSRYGDEVLSPDKSYSVVHFSEYGVLSGGDVRDELYTGYLCAFVRMSDGCVLNVEVGAQCGGEWSEDSRWSVPGESALPSLLRNGTTVGGVYRRYSYQREHSVQDASPKVMRYLSQGTTFENLLVCDPPSGKNEDIYNELMLRLVSDGDEDNAAKLRVQLNEMIR